MWSLKFAGRGRRHHIFWIFFNKIWQKDKHEMSEKNEVYLGVSLRLGCIFFKNFLFLVVSLPQPCTLMTYWSCKKWCPIWRGGSQPGSVSGLRHRLPMEGTCLVPRVNCSIFIKALFLRAFSLSSFCRIHWGLGLYLSRGAIKKSSKFLPNITWAGVLSVYSLVHSTSLLAEQYAGMDNLAGQEVGLEHLDVIEHVLCSFYTFPRSDHRPPHTRLSSQSHASYPLVSTMECLQYCSMEDMRNNNSVFVKWNTINMWQLISVCWYYSRSSVLATFSLAEMPQFSGGPAHHIYHLFPRYWLRHVCSY